MTNIESLFFYIISFSISAYLVGSFRHKPTINAFELLGISIPIIIAAVRYSVGTDFDTYMNIFERLRSQSWQEVLELKNVFNEIGFLVFSKLLYFEGDSKLVLGGIALITIVPVYLVLKKEYPKASIGISFFWFLTMYYCGSFNIMSQSIAVSIVFYALKYIFSGNAKKYFLFIFIAFLFHMSALIAIPIWFLWDKEHDTVINGKKRLLIIGATALAAYFYQEVIEWVATSFSVFDKYSGYAVTSTLGKNRDLLVNIFELGIFLVAGKRLIRLDKRNEMFILMFIIFTIIGFTGFTSPYVKRIGLYYVYPTMIMLGYLPYTVGTKTQPLMKTLIVYFCVALFWLIFYILDQSGVIPYNFQV